MVVVQSLSRVWLLVTPWTAAHQASLFFTISLSLLKLTLVESMRPFNHFVFCHPFSSCPPSFPASGSFPSSWLFASGGQSTGASASASVLSMKIQDWFPLGLTGLISLHTSSHIAVWKLLLEGSAIAHLSQHRIWSMPVHNLHVSLNR